MIPQLSIHSSISEVCSISQGVRKGLPTSSGSNYKSGGGLSQAGSGGLWLSQSGAWGGVRVSLCGEMGDLNKDGPRRGAVKATRKWEWPCPKSMLIALGGKSCPSPSNAQAAPAYTIAQRTSTHPGATWGGVPGNLSRKQKEVRVLFSWTFLESFDYVRGRRLGVTGQRGWMFQGLFTMPT